MLFAKTDAVLQRTALDLLLDLDLHGLVDEDQLEDYTKRMEAMAKDFNKYGKLLRRYQTLKKEQNKEYTN